MNNDIFRESKRYHIQHLKGVACCDHVHRSAEMTVVVSGSLAVGHEGETVVMHEREGMFIMPYELHKYRSEEKNCEAVIIEFDRSAISELVNVHGIGGVKFGLSEECVSYILNRIDNNSLSETFLKSMIYPVLSEFFDGHTAIRKEEKTCEIYLKALKFIDQKFAEDITLKDAAEAIGCSYVHLSRVFSKSVGISFTAYLNRYRISNSLASLKSSDMNITEIAYKNGFGNLRSYNREFKKMFNMTPGEYRADKNGKF